MFGLVELGEEVVDGVAVDEDAGGEVEFCLFGSVAVSKTGCEWKIRGVTDGSLLTFAQSPLMLKTVLIISG